VNEAKMQTPVITLENTQAGEIELPEALFGATPQGWRGAWACGA